MSNFVSLHTSLTGLRAAQIGLDTAAHNVANASTPGYTRQRVDLRSRLPFQSVVGPIGTGVDVAGVERVRDAFLDARVRTGLQQSGFFDTRAELLARVETVLAEPENGISGELGALWDAFEDLALDPAGGAARQQVVAALGALAGRINAIHVGWRQLEADTSTRLDTSLDEANRLLEQVADLNDKIATEQLRGTSPNDLLDQRDVALDRLSTLVGTTVDRLADGTVTVALGGVTLVSGAAPANQLQVSAGGATLDVVDSGGAPVAAGIAAGGEVAGLQQFLAAELPAQRTRLEDVVTTLANTLADQHDDGFTPAGTPGGPMLSVDFTDPNEPVTVLVGPDDLAAASTAGATHDGSNAQALADLRGGPPDELLRTLIVDLGAEVSSAQRAADAQAGLTLSATTARLSVHSVSLDEEMVATVQYQRALEANSRVMTAVDEALDTLINRTGIVGR